MSEEQDVTAARPPTRPTFGKAELLLCVWKEMTPYRWQQLTPAKKREQLQKLPRAALESAQLIA